MGVCGSEFMAGWLDEWMDEQTAKHSVLSFFKLPQKATIHQNTSTFSNFWNRNKVHFYIRPFCKYDIADKYGSFFKVVVFNS